ncbi:hypothetical protein M5K25_015800 [Dendrobium thyrsiflorum]|uniref:Uncharacterized protein n=1 Tax=Dendrobium thyrsiflorum TaxID=117978 RepID=A0ABD0UZ98_DENTH
MVNRRSSRIVGASRSNSHQSRNQSMNYRQPISASFYPGGQNVAGEGTSGPSLEERIRKMEESHNEILQLLRETRQPALQQREEVLLPRDPPGIEEVQPEHLQAEIHLPPPRRHPRSLQDNELADTASSTHPSQTGQQHLIPPDLHEDLAQPYVAELPRDTLRRELRKLSLEDQSQGDSIRPLPHRLIPDAAITPVLRLLPVEGLSSDIYPTLNFLRSPKFCPSPDFCDAGLSPVKLLPRHRTFICLLPNVRGPGPEQGMPPVQGQGKASTEIEGGRKAKDLISAVHSNHSEITPDFSLIYEPCHSQKSINRALISPRKGTQGNKARGEEKKKKRREEGKEGRNSSSTTAGFSSDAETLPDFQVTPEFCTTLK